MQLQQAAPSQGPATGGAQSTTVVARVRYPRPMSGLWETMATAEPFGSPEPRALYSIEPTRRRKRIELWRKGVSFVVPIDPPGNEQQLKLTRVERGKCCSAAAAEGEEPVCVDAGENDDYWGTPAMWRSSGAELRRVSQNAALLGLPMQEPLELRRDLRSVNAFLEFAAPAMLIGLAVYLLSLDPHSAAIYVYLLIAVLLLAFRVWVACGRRPGPRRIGSMALRARLAYEKLPTLPDAAKSVLAGVAPFLPPAFLLCTAFLKSAKGSGVASAMESITIAVIMLVLVAMMQAAPAVATRAGRYELCIASAFAVLIVVGLLGLLMCSIAMSNQLWKEVESKRSEAVACMDCTIILAFVCSKVLQLLGTRMVSDVSEGVINSILTQSKTTRLK